MNWVKSTEIYRFEAGLGCSRYLLISRNHGTCTFVGEDLHQDGVGYTTVHNDDVLHALVDSLDTAVHLGDHTAGDDALLIQRLRLGDGDLGNQRVGVNKYNTVWETVCQRVSFLRAIVSSSLGTRPLGNKRLLQFMQLLPSGDPVTKLPKKKCQQDYFSFQKVILLSNQQCDKHLI